MLDPNEKLDQLKKRLWWGKGGGIKKLLHRVPVIHRKGRWGDRGRGSQQEAPGKPGEKKGRANHWCGMARGGRQKPGVEIKGR